MEVKEIFPELTPDQIDQLKDLAENKNLANISTTHESYGSLWVLQLSNEARQYDTYQEFKDRHKRPPTISNTIIGDVNYSQVGTHDSSFDILNPITTPKRINNKWTRICIAIWEKSKWLILTVLTILIGLFIEYKTGFFIPK
jgi:hypothetical protein